MTEFHRIKFAVGDLVKPRPGTELKLGRTGSVGTVIAAESIEGWGDGIKVEWPGEEPPWSWQEASLFYPA